MRRFLIGVFAAGAATGIMLGATAAPANAARVVGVDLPISKQIVVTVKPVYPEQPINSGRNVVSVSVDLNLQGIDLPGELGL